jgi:hypothetical protein
MDLQKTGSIDRLTLLRRSLWTEENNLHSAKPAMDGKIFNSNGKHVAVLRGSSILSTCGQKLYNLKGGKI